MLAQITVRGWKDLITAGAQSPLALVALICVLAVLGILAFLIQKQRSGPGLKSNQFFIIILAVIILMFGLAYIVVIRMPIASASTGEGVDPNKVALPPSTSPTSVKTSDPTTPAPTYHDDLIMAIRVNAGPLPDQESRASDNFSLSPSAGGNFVWKIEGTDPNGITFALVKDISFGPDSAVAEDLKDGAMTPSIRGSNLYIARVHGAKSSFTLKILERFNK